MAPMTVSELQAYARLSPLPMMHFRPAHNSDGSNAQRYNQIAQMLDNNKQMAVIPLFAEDKGLVLFATTGQNAAGQPLMTKLMCVVCIVSDRTLDEGHY